jgi:hypothetical protein
VPVSASDVQAPSLGFMTFGKPRPLTIPEIKDVVDRFAFAAKVLYDVVSLVVFLLQIADLHVYSRPAQMVHSYTQL